MPSPRPPQPETPARDAFESHRAQVAEGMQLAYLREGAGGYPLLLVRPREEVRRRLLASRDNTPLSIQE